RGPRSDATDLAESHRPERRREDRGRPGRRSHRRRSLPWHWALAPGRRGSGRRPPRAPRQLVTNAGGDVMDWVLKAVRGAVTVDEDRPEKVVEAAKEVTIAALEANGLVPER